MFVYTLNIQAVPGTREKGGMGGGEKGLTYIKRKIGEEMDGNMYE